MSFTKMSSGFLVPPRIPEATTTLLLALLIACNPEPADTAPVSDTGETDTDTDADADTDTDTDTDLPGGVSTLAGSGEMANIDGVGGAAAFYEPKAIALGPDGNLYTAGMTDAVRVVTMQGEVSTLGLSGRGPSTTSGMAVDADGALYIADSDQHCIFRIADGVSQVFAGSCGGSGMNDGGAALLKRPRGMDFDDDGNLIVADTENMRIRSISPDGVASTLAGVDGIGGPTEGPVASAVVYYPLDVAVADDGAVYFTGLDNCVRRVASGRVENVAGLCQNWSSEGTQDGAAANARFNSPFALAFAPTGELYVSDSFNDRIRVLSADMAEVTTLTGSERGYADGSLDEALFDVPRGIALDAEGNLFVADSVNHRIRVVVQ